MTYEVIAYFSVVCEVEAETEHEAIEKVAQQIKNNNVAPIPDAFECRVIN